MRGQRIAISLPQVIVHDLLHFAGKIPTIPVQRQMNLQPLVEARFALTDRPSWTAIFTKAYAIVADEFPELRRVYVDMLKPYLREYPTSIVSIAFERKYEGELAVFTARIKNPSSKKVDRITRMLRRFSNDPIETVSDFRRNLKLARIPRPIRRLIWWLALHSPIHKRNHVGTFGVSVYSALGAESLHPLSPVTTTLNYGVIAPDGSVTVRVVYDHRVLNGATMARALVRLETVLNEKLAEELRELKLSSAASSTTK